MVCRVVLGGEGRWDYLTFDAPRHRLLVSHGSEVLVVGGDSGNVLGVIRNTEGVHGVALAQDLGRGFTSNGRAATVAEFDLATLEPIRQIATTGQNPDAILYDSGSRRVFTFNGRSANATVIDAATGAAPRVIEDVTTEPGARTMALDPASHGTFALLM